ncbi:MAG TPA: hypothetical protein VGH06_02285 [Candidatus Udaeobacter sp.]
MQNAVDRIPDAIALLSFFLVPGLRKRPTLYLLPDPIPEPARDQTKLAMSFGRDEAIVCGAIACGPAVTGLRPGFGNLVKEAFPDFPAQAHDTKPPAIARDHTP